MNVTRAQIRAARALVDWTVRDLSERAKVHRNTISAFESGNTEPNPATLTVLRTVLESAGVEFIEQNGAGPGVRLRDRID